MIRFNHHREISKAGYAYRTLIAILSIIVLVLCIPRSGDTHRKYTENMIGKYWFDNPVFAKRNIPILKDEHVVKQEQDKIKKDYSPIFNVNRRTAAEQIAQLRELYHQKLSSSVKFYYRDYLVQKLNTVYEAGILSTEDYERLQAEGRKSFTIAEQNNATVRNLDKAFTPKTAYEYLMHDEDTERYKQGILQKFNLSKFVTPNLTYDKARSDAELQSRLATMSIYAGEIKAGQEIVHRGQIVDKETLLLLRSVEKAENEDGRQTPQMRWSQIGGQTLYVTLIVLCLLLYFSQFRSDYLEKPRTVILIVLMALIFPMVTYLLVKHGLNVYIIPYCMLPIFLRVFMDSRTAFITHVSSIMLSAIAISMPFNFITTQLVGGLVAIFSLRELSQRSELFRASILVMLASLACYLCFDLINLTFLSGQVFDYMPYLYIVLNGFLLLISYLLLFPFERIFKFTSNVTLVELSNTNNEILRELSEKASGTFQHSMQVANLAGEVANKIGASSQLVRTGALYHDIGKLSNPSFFTENQGGFNPHTNLSYEKSADIIIKHVKDGLALADKHGLPKVIKDFIATHHATSKAKYFYVSYKNAHPDGPIDESRFTYPGPNPTTLEQAILMMADAVEAASRSLKQYTEASVTELVDRIVDSQVQEGYFNHCPITFEDISTAKDVMRKKLMTIYHTRISYPELNFPPNQ